MRCNGRQKNLLRKTHKLILIIWIWCAAETSSIHRIMLYGINSNFLAFRIYGLLHVDFIVKSIYQYSKIFYKNRSFFLLHQHIVVPFFHGCIILSERYMWISLMPRLCVVSTAILAVDPPPTIFVQEILPDGRPSTPTTTRLGSCKRV
jgi:hypothetical protein